MTPEAYRYSLRRVNPFEGVVQVLELDAARAVSRDGIEWEIQIEAEGPGGAWGSLNTGSTVRRFLRFGVWSQRRGLRRAPLNPMLDLDELLEESARLIDALQASLGDLPFPPADRFEHWLLDTQSRPLALLATTDDPERIPDLRPEPWQAARLADHDFRSDALADDPVNPGEAENPRRHPAAIEAVIRRAAGHTPVQQWFERRADGSGRGLAHRAPPALAGRELSAGQFPELPWHDRWDDPGDLALMADYVAWSAPRLLTLHGLSDRTRARLEAQARQQALAVDALFQLYPRILDRGLVEAARVEARLRRASAS